MEKPERLELQSADGVQLNLDALYQIAPSCFTGDPAKINIYETFKQLMNWSDRETVKNIRVI